jgi:hypothetical protein
MQAVAAMMIDFPYMAQRSSFREHNRRRLQLFLLAGCGFRVGEGTFCGELLDAQPPTQPHSSVVVDRPIRLNGKPQRRIWPSTKIIPPNLGVWIPRISDSWYPRNSGGFNKKGTSTKSVRMTTTQTAARKAAELRDEAVRQRSPPMTRRPQVMRGPARRHARRSRVARLPRHLNAVLVFSPPPSRTRPIRKVRLGSARFPIQAAASLAVRLLN